MIVLTDAFDIELLHSLNGMKSNLNPYLYETKSNLTKQNTLEKCPLKFQQLGSTVLEESWGQLTFTWDS